MTTETENAGGMNGDGRSKEWVLERVQKLLNLGNDPGAAEGERDNALRMAHKLLAKYNLGIAEVESESGRRDAADDGNRGTHIFTFEGRPWARQLSMNVAKLFFCEYLFGNAPRSGNVRHYFVGKESNAVTAAKMSEYLITSIWREGRARARAAGDNSSAWHRSFCTGASNVLIKRIKQMIEDAKRPDADAAAGKSLVLASLYDRESRANQLVIANMKTRTSKHRQKNDLNYSAFETGRAYGATVSLNKQVK